MTQLRRTRTRSTTAPIPSLAVLVRDIANAGHAVRLAGRRCRPKRVGNIRNDMYLASEALRFLMKDKEAELERRRRRDAQQLQGLARRRDQVHPDLGEDRGRHRARPRHDDRLEAHRRHRRREDRQDASDLRARAPPPKSSRPRTIGAADGSACRSRPRTCCRPASPARWRPTARACSGRRSATSRWPGC